MRSNQQALKEAGGLGIFTLLANALRRSAPRNTPTDHTGKLSTQDAGTAPPRRRGLLERLDQWQWSLRQRDLEAYLGKATDLCDLEIRLRALERPVNYRC